MANTINMSGKDIPIEKLVPLNERNIDYKPSKGYHKILSSIMTIGLIEPLCVYQEENYYVILDGFLRFKACEQLGVKEVPCLFFKHKEGYTFNRMVNRLSPYQESRMLRESLKTIDKATIADVFGIKSISYRLGTEIYKYLHPRVISMVDKNLMGRKSASELTHVNHERQLELINEMKKNNDYSVSLVRALVIKTPLEQRNPNKRRRRPWAQDSHKKQELVSKLEEVGKKYDFYTNLYRQYSIDLLKLCIYIRKIITNETIRDYLRSNHIEILDRFEKIVFEDERREAV